MKKKKLLVIGLTTLLFSGLTTNLVSCNNNPIEEDQTQYILELKSEPNKKTFLVGDRLDLTGLVVVKYTKKGEESSSPITVSEEDYVLSVKEGTVLTEANLDFVVTLGIAEEGYNTLSLHFIVKEADTYVVTFENANGETLASQSAKEGDTSISYEGPYPYLENENEDKVNLFKGWKEKGDETNTIVDLANYTFSKDVTFVAVYEESDALTDGTYKYNLNKNGYLSVAGFTSKNDSEGNPITVVDIPSEYAGFKIKEIESKAFYQNTSLLEIKMSDEITYIGEQAFSGCNKVTSLTLSNNLEEMGDSACSSLNSLTGTLTIPGSLKVIPRRAFYNSSSGGCLVNNLVLSEGIEEIGENAFYGFKSILSLNIPDSVTKLDSGCFCACNILYEVHLGKGVSSIDDTYLDSPSTTTNAIHSYTVSEDNPYLAAKDGILYNKDYTTLVRVPINYNEKDEDTGEYVTDTFTLLDSVTTIGKNAFKAHSTDYVTFKMGDNVKYIEEQAFQYTKNLKIEFSNSLLEIGKCAFQGNTGFDATVVMPDTVTTIADQAFKSCTTIKDFYFGRDMANFGIKMFDGNKSVELHFSESNTNYKIEDGVIYSFDMTKAILFCSTDTTITSYAMPNTVKEVSPSFLESNSKITSLSLSTSLEKVGENAFKSMSKVTSELVLPSTLKEVGASAFYGMSNVSKINIPTSLTYIGDSAFSGLAAAQIEEVTLNSDIEYLGTSAFYNCKLLKKATVNHALSESLFKSCTGLTSVSLADSISELPISVFEGCSSLEVLNVPASLTTISKYALKGTAISEFTLPSSLTTLDTYALSETSIKEVIVPSSVTNFGDHVFAKSSVESVAINTNIEKLPDFTFTNCASLTSVTLPTTIKEYGEGVFSSCSALTSFNVDDNVTILGEKTFSDCTSLVSVHLSENLETIGSQTFSGCSSLTTVNIPSKLEELPYMQFYKCSSLTSIEIPTNISEIKGAMLQNSAITSFTLKENQYFDDAGSQLAGCSNLETVTINNPSITEFVTGLFNGDKKLTTITLSDGDKITKIFSSTFKDCASLTSLDINYDNLVSIGNNAFNGCTSLTNVKFTSSSNLEKVENYTFQNCSSLEGDFYLPSTVTSLGSYIFSGCSKLTSLTIDSSSFTTSNYMFRNSGITKVVCKNISSSDASTLFATKKTGLTKGKLTVECSDQTITI